MSRTDKDTPYRILAAREGYIDHDHRNGECVISTDAPHLRTSMHRHYAACPRYTWEATCVHDAGREQYQQAIDHARASGNRPRSSIAVGEMIRAGYYPNCPAAKTHPVNLEEIDLRLLPGEERIYYTAGPFIARITEETHYTQLRRTYRPEIPCAICEGAVAATCYHVLPRKGRSASCSCCTDDRPADSPTRVRDRLRQYAKEYNTTGDVDEVD